VRLRRGEVLDHVLARSAVGDVVLVAGPVLAFAEGRLVEAPDDPDPAPFGALEHVVEARRAKGVVRAELPLHFEVERARRERLEVDAQVVPAKRGELVEVHVILHAGARRLPQVRAYADPVERRAVVVLEVVPVPPTDADEPRGIRGDALKRAHRGRAHALSPHEQLQAPLIPPHLCRRDAHAPARVAVRDVVLLSPEVLDAVGHVVEAIHGDLCPARAGEVSPEVDLIEVVGIRELLMDARDHLEPGESLHLSAAVLGALHEGRGACGLSLRHRSAGADRDRREQNDRPRERATARQPTRVRHAQPSTFALTLSTSTSGPLISCAADHTRR